jgi:hypothetical protein
VLSSASDSDAHQGERDDVWPDRDVRMLLITATSTGGPDPFLESEIDTTAPFSVMWRCW